MAIIDFNSAHFQLTQINNKNVYTGNKGNYRYIKSVVVAIAWNMPNDIAKKRNDVSAFNANGQFSG